LLAITFGVFEYRLFHLFFSPVLAVMAASQGIINGSLVIYLLLFLSSLFLGRAWCGWLCPGGAINTACAHLIRKPLRRSKATVIKYGIFALLAGVIGVLALRAGGFHALDPFWGLNRTSALQDFLLVFGAIGIIVPVAFWLGKHAHCHYFCWQAPILILGATIKAYGKWPALHLTAKPADCRRCGICEHRCPMSLQVSKMVTTGKLHHADCVLCGNCVDACPQGIIHYAFGFPR